MTDKRRKLTDDEYIRIRVMYRLGNTIRQIANTLGISTKYVKRQINKRPYDNLEWQYSTPSEPRGVFECSGCHRAFLSLADYDIHLNIWTSGGKHGLDCFRVVPQHPKLAEN